MGPSLSCRGIQIGPFILCLIALAYFFGRLLAGFLFGVQPHDLGTMLAVTILLLACGLAAAYLPARTASRVDPMQALRGE